MHIDPKIPFRKQELLRYVKDLRIEKWEGWNYPPEIEPPGFDYVFPGDHLEGKQLVVQMGLNSKGVYRLRWRRCETRQVLELHQVLSELLKHHMPSLEKFWYVCRGLFSFPYWVQDARAIVDSPLCLSLLRRGNSYNPQRYLSIPIGDQFLPLPPVVPEVRINGITFSLFQALKELPGLKSLMVNFYMWDPLSPSAGGLQTIVHIPAYRPENDGLVGFKNLDELIVLGISADKRFFEIGVVVKDCLLLSNPRRRLSRLEIRVDPWWHEGLQDMRSVNETQDLWDWAVSLWGRCFGPAENLRCVRGLNSTRINVILEFGPIRWQWECPENLGFVCRIEDLTTINLRNVHPKQIVGAIRRLAKTGTPSLKVFAVECRLIQINMFLKRFCGLKELYIFEPEAKANDEARDALWSKRWYSHLIPEAAQQKPISLKGAQWTLDTILKHHLRTLEVLVIEEMICPPRVNCAGSAINGIGGWRVSGGRLKELGVRLWGSWEDMGEFMTAFEGLRSLHLLNRHRSDAIVPVQDIPMYLQTVTRKLTNQTCCLYNAETTALRIANLWGRDLICSRKKATPGVMDFDRWIGVGPHSLESADNWRWKWRIDKAAKYMNWEDGPEFVGNEYTNVWEEGGRMWKVLREGAVLTRDDCPPFEEG